MCTSYTFSIPKLWKIVLLHFVLSYFIMCLIFWSVVGDLPCATWSFNLSRIDMLYFSSFWLCELFTFVHFWGPHFWNSRNLQSALTWNPIPLSKCNSYVDYHMMQTKVDNSPMLEGRILQVKWHIHLSVGISNFVFYISIGTFFSCVNFIILPHNYGFGHV